MHSSCKGGEEAEFQESDGLFFLCNVSPKFWKDCSFNASADNGLGEKIGGGREVSKGLSAELTHGSRVQTASGGRIVWGPGA